MSSDNCPVGCEHCARDNAEEAEERRIAKQQREEEDDANFADQEE